MSASFGPSPKLKQYCDWARTEAGCTVKSGIIGKKSMIRIEAPDGRFVHQIAIETDEPLCHSVVAHLDRRLGLNSPFPKTPDPYD